MITYFPHSTTNDNLSELCSGWNDVELSELGVTQAETLKWKLRDCEFDYIYCSDLKRAIQTAEIVFPKRDIVHDSRLREMNYGLMNGEHKSKFGGIEVYERGFTEGESLQNVEARIQDFLNETNWNDYKIAVISHRFPQLALEVRINRKSWDEAINSDWREGGKWQPGWQYL